MLCRTERKPLLPDADNAAEGKSNRFSSIPEVLTIMSILGIIALVFGVAGVLLTIKQSIWCWPAALISVVTSGYEFYESRLFGDMALQVFYFVSGVYGWIYWAKGKDGAEPPIVAMGWSRAAIVLAATAAAAGGLGWLAGQVTDAQASTFDAMLTGLSVVAQILLSRKVLENWLFWIITDILSIGVYASQGLYPTAALYVVLLVLATWGLWEWQRARRVAG